MGLTSALNTSLNGLALNEVVIDVLGNNVANAGTNGFKASSVRFETQLSRTYSLGSAPTEINGGTNPRQSGLGASVSAIARDFGQGSVTNSSSPSDLAIQGSGFFILDGSNGRTYTRNGNFTLNSASYLVNDQGQFVQGYTINQKTFELVDSQISKLQIPLGVLNIAKKTTEFSLSGSLLPTGPLSDKGSAINSDPIIVAGGTPATGTTLLSAAQNAGGTPLFAVGDTLAFTPQKGGRLLSNAGFTVTATSTVNNLLQYISDTIGIQNTGSPPATGVSIDVNGRIQVAGNGGEANDISISSGDLRRNGSSVPIQFTKTQDAVGGGVSTEFEVYDSLGQPLDLRVTTVLESRSAGATTYRYFVESNGDRRTGIGIGTGTITFDSQGVISGPSKAQISVESGNTAADSPVAITMDFSQISGIASAGAGSQLALSLQDGSRPGTLQSFTIDDTGNINGVFDNGLIRGLGKVLLARFSNEQGLTESGGTTFRQGINSGEPIPVAPGSQGLGTIRAGSIELSNTDIGKNLVDLITASTNYRGNTRVISAVQQLVNELLQLGR